MISDPIRPAFDGTSPLALRRHPANLFTPTTPAQGVSSLNVVRNGEADSTQTGRLRTALIRRALVLDLQQVPGALAKLPDNAFSKLVVSRNRLAEIFKKRGFSDLAEILKSSTVKIPKGDIVLMTLAAATGSRDDLEKLAGRNGLLQQQGVRGTPLNPAVFSSPALSAGRVVLLVK